MCLCCPTDCPTDVFIYLLPPTHRVRGRGVCDAGCRMSFMDENSTYHLSRYTLTVNERVGEMTQSSSILYTIVGSVSRGVDLAMARGVWLAPRGVYPGHIPHNCKRVSRHTTRQPIKVQECNSKQWQI